VRNIWLSLSKLPQAQDGPMNSKLSIAESEK
jgi:hypothetical protein